MSLTDLPVPFVPSIPMMGAGLLLVPAGCLVVLILMARHWSRSLPRPALLVVFFATVAAAVAVTVFGDWWAYSLQTLIAMSTAALGVAVEVAARRLQRHWASAGGAALVCTGYYLFLVSAVASAGV